MTGDAFVVCHTGEPPPEAVRARAERAGITFVALDGADGTGATGIAARLEELAPDAYVLNDPDYGPYLTAELADAAGDLALVTYIGHTLEPGDYEPYVDLGALDERGIAFTAAPGTATTSVAEGALTLLLALNLDLVTRNAAVKGGGDPVVATRDPLHGATLGVVGVGSIGQRVARLAQALGMSIVYHARRRRYDLEDELGCRHLDLPDLFAASDHVSVHTAVASSRGLIDREVLLRGDGLHLVNTAGPAVVDPDALLEALAHGWVRRAALDGEYPPPHRQRFRELADDRFIVLPFVSWKTTTTRTRQWEPFLESARAVIAGRPVPHRVR